MVCLCIYRKSCKINMCSYTLEDYNNILFSGISYGLPKEVSDKIQSLYENLGVIETATPAPTTAAESFPKKMYKNTNQGFSKQKRNQGAPRLATPPPESWERTPIFKSTKMEKKEGVEKMINDIRICLNKISNKNYDTQKETILKHISDIIEKDDSSVSSSEDENPDDEMNKIANAVFDIASTNKFYSELYATLYKDLIQNYPLFQKIIPNFVHKYKCSLDAIEVVDPNTDYDKYCENNKLNDKRKAMSAFIVNLMKKGILEKEFVLELIDHLQQMISINIDVEEKIGVVDEITENIFIFVTMSASDISAIDGWTIVIDHIVMCSKLKSKEHPGISSRCVFKYMDVLDSIKKITVVSTDE